MKMEKLNKKIEFSRLTRERDLLKASVKELEQEIKRLSEIITDLNQGDCEMGFWCDDCVHCGYESSLVSVWSGFDFYNGLFGKTIFCKKAVHKRCSGFEPQEGIVKRRQEKMRLDSAKSDFEW